MNSDWPSIEGLYETPLRASLAWKYKWQRFLAITQEGKDALIVLGQIILCIAIATYFYAHFINWIVNHPHETNKIQSLGRR